MSARSGALFNRRRCLYDRGGSVVLKAATLLSISGSMLVTDNSRRSAIPVLVLVWALLAPAGAASAQEAGDTVSNDTVANDTVSFVGAGWGHGVGLSQYGAYGASRDGWTAEQILEYFYQGSSLGVIGEGGLAPRENLWVNLEKDRTQLVLIAHETGLATPEPMVLARGEDTWELGKDYRLVIDWESSSNTCALEIQDAAGVPVADQPGSGPCSAEITWDGWVDKPSRKVQIDGCEQMDWNAGAYAPCEYARGDLHLRVGPGGMDLSVELDIDDYVLGISEMPYYWGVSGGFEALKAQAIAARSYARELQIYRDPPGDNACAAWCDVRDTTFDQRYVGWGHVGTGIDEWITAVMDTAGKVVTHPAAPSGGVVRAYYSSSSGGATENVNEIWAAFPSPVPYYTSVADPWALDPSINGNAAWTQTFGTGTVAATVGLDVVTAVAVIERNTSTSARTVRFAGLRDGEPTTRDYSGASVKSLFGLKSIYFDVQFGDLVPPPFSDVSGSVHYADIVYIADLGITKGCNPPANSLYCPDDEVTRGQMAAFLVRALGLTDDGGVNWFTDDDGSVFEADINKLAAAEITFGCNAGGTTFCPKDSVTRGEMAAFLTRAYGYDDPGAGDWFIDDDDSMFEGNIDRLRVAGVTVGCNPPANDRFCPDDPVLRDQMASFLARALRG